MELEGVHLHAGDETRQVLDPEYARILAAELLERACPDGLRHARQLVLLEKGLGQVVVGGDPHPRSTQVKATLVWKRPETGIVDLLIPFPWGIAA